MLPPFIIDQIRRREEQEQEAPQRRQRVELPIPTRALPITEEDEKRRGVVVIDLG